MKAIRNKLRLRRKKRVRAKIFGTSQEPRLCVFRSNRRIEVQLIDDSIGKTLFSADSKNTKTEKSLAGAKELGKKIAEKCLSHKIDKIVFDRGGYKYHGKVKAVADGAREGGLQF